MLEFLSCVVAGSLAYLLGFLRGSSGNSKVDDQPSGEHAGNDLQAGGNFLGKRSLAEQGDRCEPND